MITVVNLAVEIAIYSVNYRLCVCYRWRGRVEMGGEFKIGGGPRYPSRTFGNGISRAQPETFTSQVEIAPE